MNADAAPPILLILVTGWARAGALVGWLARGFSLHLVRVPQRLLAGDRAQPIARRVGSACAKTGEER